MGLLSHALDAIPFILSRQSVAFHCDLEFEIMIGHLKLIQSVFNHSDLRIVGRIDVQIRVVHQNRFDPYRLTWFRGSWTGNYEMLTGNASDDVLARTSAEKSS